MTQLESPSLYQTRHLIIELTPHRILLVRLLLHHTWVLKWRGSWKEKKLNQGQLFNSTSRVNLNKDNNKSTKTKKFNLEKEMSLLLPIQQQQLQVVLQFLLRLKLKVTRQYIHLLLLTMRTYNLRLFSSNVLLVSLTQNSRRKWCKWSVTEYLLKILEIEKRLISPSLKMLKMSSN